MITFNYNELAVAVAVVGIMALIFLVWLLLRLFAKRQMIPEMAKTRGFMERVYRYKESVKVKWRTDETAVTGTMGVFRWVLYKEVTGEWGWLFQVKCTATDDYEVIYCSEEDFHTREAAAKDMRFVIGTAFPMNLQYMMEESKLTGREKWGFEDEEDDAGESQPRTILL